MPKNKGKGGKNRRRGKNENVRSAPPATRARSLAPTASLSLRLQHAC